MLVVDAVVDHRDLDAVTPRPRQRRERRRPEHRRPAVQVEVVREARVDALRDAGLEQRGQAAVRDAHREAVHEHLVAARDDRLRDRLGAARAIARACSCLRACRGRSARTRSSRSASLRGPNPPSRRANVAAASGGSSSVMITRTRLLPIRPEARTGRAPAGPSGAPARRRCAASGRSSPRPSRLWRRRRGGRRGALGVALAAELANLPREALRRLQPFEHHRHGSPERLALRRGRDVPRADRRPALHPLDLRLEPRVPDPPDARHPAVLHGRAGVRAGRDEPERERLAGLRRLRRRLEALHDERRRRDLHLVAVQTRTGRRRDVRDRVREVEVARRRIDGDPGERR